MANKAQPTITAIASFPEHYMLENLVVRADGSILVVASPQRQVWYVPPPAQAPLLPVTPQLLYTLPENHLAQCFVEAEPNVFYVATYGVPTLWRFDLRQWKAGDPVNPVKIFDFESKAGPNGGGMIAPGTMVISDCVLGLIWRVDLAKDGLNAKATVWSKHPSMAAGGGKPPVQFAGGQSVPYPGINGLRVGPKTKFVYYSTSSQEVFYKVPFDSATSEATGEAEFIANVPLCDDFCLDEDRGFAYISEHPRHTIERVPLTKNAPGREAVVGQPFNDLIIGPTSTSWGTAPGDYGHVFYTTTDGGTVQLAPDGVTRPARLMRVELAAE